MIHVAFTITDNEALIIIKDNSKREIKRESIDLGPALSNSVKEWHAARAAVRLAGAWRRESVRLYSDLSVIDDLGQSIGGVVPEPLRFAEKPTVKNFGPVHLPNDGMDRERTLYLDTVTMLVTLFDKWEVLRVEKERIV